MMTGLGAAGERTTGKRDVATEAGLPVVQLLVMIGIAVVTSIGVLLAAWSIGRRGVFVLSVVGIFVARDAAVKVRRWLAAHDWPQAVRFLWYAERWVPWLWLALGLIALRYLMPFNWELNLETGDHLLVLLRQGQYGVLNKLVDVAPIVRIMALVVGCAIVAVSGIGWRHFKNELDAFYPMKAIDPSEKGVDPRGWAKQQAPVEGAQEITVNLDTVVRGRSDRVGADGVYTGDQIVYNKVHATRAEWIAVTRVALTGVFPTEAVMMLNGFSGPRWRTMRDSLAEAGLIKKRGNGNKGQNAGYDFTDTGREFFKERRWDPQERANY